MAMIIFGGIKLAGYFSGDLYRLAFQYDLVRDLINCPRTYHPDKTA